MDVNPDCIQIMTTSQTLIKSTVKFKGTMLPFRFFPFLSLYYSAFKFKFSNLPENKQHNKERRVLCPKNLF